MNCKEGAVNALSYDGPQANGETIGIMDRNKDLEGIKRTLGITEMPISPKTGKPMDYGDVLAGIDCNGKVDVKSTMFVDRADGKTYRYDMYDTQGRPRPSLESQITQDRMEIRNEMNRVKSAEVAPVQPLCENQSNPVPENMTVGNINRVENYRYMCYDRGQKPYNVNGTTQYYKNELKELKGIEAYGPSGNKLEYDGCELYTNVDSGRSGVVTVYYKDNDSNERYRFDRFEEQDGKYIKNPDFRTQVLNDNAHPEHTLTYHPQSRDKEAEREM